MNEDEIIAVSDLTIATSDFVIVANWTEDGSDKRSWSIMRLPHALRVSVR